jgi:putative heme-binding domain-containing protein
VLKWFEDAGRDFDNGVSAKKFMTNIRRDAMSTLGNEETLALADVLAAWPPAQKSLPQPAHPRPLVKEWTMADLEPALAQVAHGRNFERGREMFETSQCLACHRFAGQGGAIGPDLSVISSRFSRHDILESIILPSKVISEQYIDTIFKLNSGEVMVGRLIGDQPDHYVVRPNPLEPEKTVTIKKSDVKLKAASKISPMPEGLVNGLTPEQIYDLIAYLEAGGPKDHPDFARK